jgi:hypothetical protein
LGLGRSAPACISVPTGPPGCRRGARTGRTHACHARHAPRSHAALAPSAALQGGWETDETSAEAAARESLEEAGVRGELQARARAPPPPPSAQLAHAGRCRCRRPAPRCPHPAG